MSRDDNQDVPTVNEVAGKLKEATLGGYRSKAARANARGLNKHEQEIEDNYTMLQSFEWYTEGEGKFYEIGRAHV